MWRHKCGSKKTSEEVRGDGYLDEAAVVKKKRLRQNQENVEVKTKTELAEGLDVEGEGKGTIKKGFPIAGLGP